MDASGVEADRRWRQIVDAEHRLAAEHRFGQRSIRERIMSSSRRDTTVYDDFFGSRPDEHRDAVYRGRCTPPAGKSSFDPLRDETRMGVRQLYSAHLVQKIPPIHSVGAHSVKQVISTAESINASSQRARARDRGGPSDGSRVSGAPRSDVISADDDCSTQFDIVRSPTTAPGTLSILKYLEKIPRKYTAVVLVSSSSKIHPVPFLRQFSAIKADKVYGVGEFGESKWFKYKSIVPSFAKGVVLSGEFARSIDTKRGKISKEGSSCRREHGFYHEHFFAACLQKHFAVNITDGSGLLGCPECATESMRGRCTDTAAELLKSTVFVMMTDSPRECRTAMDNWASPVANQTYIFSSKNASEIRAACPNANVIEVVDEHFAGWRHKRLYEQRAFVILDWIARQYNQGKLAAGTKYVVGFDSDTAWNLELLPSLLVDITPSRPTIHGYMYQAWDTIYPTGGAGVVFTIPAVHAIVNAANSGSCKMANTNFDVMLGRCSDAASVERVHVEGMWQQPVAALSDEVLAAPWGVLTVHKFKDRLEVTRAFALNSPCQ
ncbi:hypothetical protein FOZ61_000584 [Perkinsus olseni]|uniref:Uncharacterized protein n=1 Tax=Perkinsus olseni TaxID=32597 RepID=A0A7J6KTL8_PEROL|nr:hypothetical protein FOZ61_000584 [Perkinsus olseni]